jgi:broad specificity phosphatase PhoE
MLRHAQTEWNRALRYQGHIDVELSPFGRSQARLLTEVMSQEPLVAIYTSDLSRSRETAEIIAAPHGLVPVLMPELREASYGEWEGLTYAEVRSRYAELVKLRRQDPLGFTPPGGESLGETARRIMAAARRVAECHASGKVAVVTHGGPLRVLVATLLEIPPRNTFRLRLDNCGITVVESFPRAPMLTLLNETRHLRALAPSLDPALGN